MDRFTKTTLAVIAACLFVIASDILGFPPKAQADSAAAGGGETNSSLAAVTKAGDVYFINDRDDIYHCINGKCTLAMDN